MGAFREAWYMNLHLWQFQAHMLALAAASLCWPCASNRGWYDATCLWWPYQFPYNINATEFVPGPEGQNYLPTNSPSLATSSSFEQDVCHYDAKKAGPSE